MTVVTAALMHVCKGDEAGEILIWSLEQVKGCQLAQEIMSKLLQPGEHHAISIFFCLKSSSLRCYDCIWDAFSVWNLAHWDAIQNLRCKPCLLGWDRENVGTTYSITLIFLHTKIHFYSSWPFSESAAS